MMPTAKAGYRTNDGKRVPSVTTILSRFKESGGLIHWAWDLGQQGIDYRDARDTAANAGTLAHDMVDRHLREMPMPTAEEAGVDEATYRKAGNAFETYLDWARQTRIEIIDTEMPLVSEEHRFGGCPDAVGRIDGVLCLLDWKTGNAVYGEQMIPQVAAYIALYNEAHPDAPITGGAHLLRFSKDEADFAHHYFRDVSDGWEAFLLMRRLYDLVAKLKKRA